MENNYAKWYDREKTWIEGISKEEREQFVKNHGLSLVRVSVVLSVAVIFVLSILIAVRMDIDPWRVFVRLFFILPFALILALVFYVKRKSTRLVKFYMKNIEAQLADFSSAEKEEFASQMLDAQNRDVVRCFFFIGRYNGGLTKDRVYVTKDYVMKAQSEGRIVLVRFSQVERMTVNDEENVWTGANGAPLYPICFYYHAGKSDKGEPDKTIIFDDPDICKEVADCIREMLQYTIFTVTD